MEQQCVQTHLVLFGEVDLPRDRAALLSELNAQLGGRLTGDQVILPIPDHAPPEIPRLQASAVDGSLRLVVARNRVEILETLEPTECAQAQQELLQHGPTLLDVIYLRAGATPTRCGLVTLWAVIDDGTDPAEMVRSAYLGGSSLFQGAAELELHHLTRCEVANINSNCWVRIQSARRQTAGTHTKRLSYLVDVNSHEATRNTFDRGTLTAFVSAAWSLTSERLEQHLATIKDAENARKNSQ